MIVVVQEQLHLILFNKFNMPFPVTPSNTPSVTPTKSVTPSITPTNTPTSTNCPAPSQTRTPNATTTHTITPSQTATNTPTITTSPTTTPTITNTPTTTSTFPVTPSTTPEFDYYLADVWDCSTCTVVQTNFLVAFSQGSIVTINGSRWYIPESGPNGYSYQTVGASTSGNALILSAGFYGNDCNEACSA